MPTFVLSYKSVCEEITKCNCESVSSIYSIGWYSCLINHKFYQVVPHCPPLSIILQIFKKTDLMFSFIIIIIIIIILNFIIYAIIIIDFMLIYLNHESLSLDHFGFTSISSWAERIFIDFNFAQSTVRNIPAILSSW